MLKRCLFVLIFIIGLLAMPAGVLAQDYSYQIPEMNVDVYWNEDGTSSLYYEIYFVNDPGGHRIDYVDLGMPNSYFSDSAVQAEADGVPVSDISSSGFQGGGPGVDSGVAIGLGSQTIPPGQSGVVRVYVPRLERVLRGDSQDSAYASAVFAPAWFETVHGETNLTVTFHLPPGVTPDQPRWHASPQGFASEPATGIDDQGRITYSWSSAQVPMDRKYDFGASFPSTYVPAEEIYTTSLSESIGVSAEDFIGFGFFCCIGLIVVGSVGLSIRTGQKRKLQYLPPKIAIEGHGIKRGLTAVEAAILLEQPLDKVLTMILFSVVKKGAAEVVTNDPLKIKALEPKPEGLLPYDEQFIKAFSEESLTDKRRALQTLMIDLVKSVSDKMKGFSRKETIVYYRDIIDRAWKEVEAANTPEVKSEAYSKVMEWTMLDQDYDDHTRRVFQGGPVFVPMWWPRYDPTFSRGATSLPVPSTKPGGGGVSLPTLPGATFAASMVRGVQNFSGSVVGNITEFTSGVTNKTNPIPVSTSGGKYSGGRSGGGCACACACACAGCACACAGGGR